LLKVPSPSLSFGMVAARLEDEEDELAFSIPKAEWKIWSNRYFLHLLSYGTPTRSILVR